jgi:hypothetical protein
MKEIQRTECVFCENIKLDSFKKLRHPVYECVDTVKNAYWNMEYGYCRECYSVQLMSLADPEILYDEHYFQPLNTSYLWIHHNISFVQFIIHHLNTDINNSILEIGSSSFCLGKHLQHYYKDYTVFDYTIKNAEKRDHIKYVEGNCETYNFMDETIVMSHVFEHLYQPKKFIENCCKNKVKNIFISVPSMEDTEQLHVANQHTFLYSEKDLEYLFGLSQYKVNGKVLYNSPDHSFPCFFFHFVFTDLVIPIDREINTTRHKYAYDYLTRQITVPKNTFLATCGSFSLITYELIENKQDVLGAIDANKKKQGRSFGNTSLLVHPYKKLKNYGPETSILVFHPKKNNIIEQIKDTNASIQILTI